jgi:membrane-associated phospholipid phosphatase
MAATYDLKGSANFPQVEPPAGFWLRSPVPCAVSLEDVRRALDHVVPNYDLSSSPAGVSDLAQVKALATHNEDATYFQSNEVLSKFLTDKSYLIDAQKRQRIPPGAVINRRDPVHSPFLKYGAELSRLFEGETPGLWHRQVLNVLLDPAIPGGPGQKLSPPRQALIWAALDVAIASALQAAWYFKWFELSGARISFRERPVEADPSIPVLFDYKVKWDSATGDIIKGPLRTDPPTHPGTPRHPAYPSGHSTYSAAASTVLGCLFPNYRTSFNLLANNIGRARLWAGVHWVQDHKTGQRIGKAVGDLVIRQLNTSGIKAAAVGDPNVPDNSKLRKFESDFYADWRVEKNFCKGIAFTDALAGASAERMNPGPEFEREDQVVMPPADGAGELDIDNDGDNIPAKEK